MLRPLHSWCLVMGVMLGSPSGHADLVWRWSNPAPHGNNVVDMGYFNGLAVQVAERGQIYTSSDFQNWTPRDSHTTNSLQAVTSFGGRILIAGANGTMVYSDDGADFAYTNLNTTDWLVGAAASPNLAVAVGDNAAIYTSLDGASWQQQAQPPQVAASWLLSVAYGGGTFVTVGEGGYIATSSNGTNWTRRAAPLANPTFTNDLNRVVWIESGSGPNPLTTSGFWAVSNGGRAIYSTNNGVTWHLVSGLGSTNALYAAAGNDHTRLLGGELDVRLGTPLANGMVWTGQTGSSLLSAPEWTYYTALWETNGSSSYWLAGDTGMLVEGYATNNTYNWRLPFYSPRDWLWDVTTVNGLYVAVGDHARIMTSDNGVDWSIEQVPSNYSISSTNTVFFGIGGHTNLLLAVGNQGSVAVSSNLFTAVVTTNFDGSLATNQVSNLGVIWSALPAPTTNDLHGVGVFTNQIFTVGGNGTILKYNGGVNWTRMAAPTTAYLSSVESFAGGLVAVGDGGTVLTSPNGTSWTKVNLSPPTTNWLYRVRCLNGTLVAIGENGTILTSADGANWIRRASGTTAWLNDIGIVANTYYVVGTQGTVLTSTNLATWTSIGANTLKSLYAVASQNGQLLAVGIEGVIIRSQVVPDLNPVNFIGFNRSDGINLWFLAGNPDQRFRLDASTNLIDWSTNGPTLEILDGSGTLWFIQDTGSNAPSPFFYRTTRLP